MTEKYKKIEITKNSKSLFGYKKRKSIKPEIGQGTKFSSLDEETRLCATKIDRFVSEI